MVELPRSEQVDQAFAAYLKSCDEGTIGSREDFLAQFPELAEELKQLLEAADLVGQVTFNQPGSGVVRRNDSVASGASTIGMGKADVGGKSDRSFSYDHDAAITLPMPNRRVGEAGPTLPFALGDYELTEVLGRGGMGVVYLASQRHLDRQVAVKMIRSGMLAGETEVRRFYTEAQAAARLKHPGIVSVYQFGHLAGHHYFSMEYIPGTDLQRMIEKAPLSCDAAAQYVRDVAQAIHHAHQKGVLHRDLKPANVLIDEQDQIHVTDFGLAKHMDGDSSVTGSGAAVGTPHYMAPEQAGGESDRATRQSDVYSLGGILFACLTGRPPLVADSVMQTLLQVVHQPAPSVRIYRPDVPADLETIVAKCLEKSPSKRYETAQQLAEDLDRYLERSPILARPRSMILKMWHWIEGVPLVAAVLGRRIVNPSVSHRRFQAAILLLALVTPLVMAIAFGVWQQSINTLPSRVSIAGGLDGGIYDELSKEIASRLQSSYPINAFVVTSNGSIDNRDRLLDRSVALAPLQSSALDHESLSVVAPLFYEAVHLLVRRDSTIQSIRQLKGKRVAVGPEGSGSRIAAELLFDAFELTHETTPREVIPWQHLSQQGMPDVAVICIGCGSRLVSEMLRDGEWLLLPIEEGVRVSLLHPTLKSMTIQPEEYEQVTLPPSGIETVGTTAFLAARYDAPEELVTATLTVLYEDPEVIPGLIPFPRAAEWQGLALHPAARRFYHKSTSE